MKLLVFLFITSFATPAVLAYDPLTLPKADLAAPLDFTVQDATRDRALPIRVYLPVASKAAPVVLFSHGLGGSRENNPYLGKHWSARGYAVVFVQHPGSDESVWKGQGPARIPMAMKEAATPINSTETTRPKAMIDGLCRAIAATDRTLSSDIDTSAITTEISARAKVGGGPSAAASPVPSSIAFCARRSSHIR